MGFSRIAAIMLAASRLFAQPEKPQEAVGAILEGFRFLPYGDLGEVHQSIQEHDLFKALVESPDFPGRVNDIVIESANSLYQPTLDRYIAGETVAQGELEKVWQNFVERLGERRSRLIMGCSPGSVRETRAFLLRSASAFSPAIRRSSGTSSGRATTLLLFSPFAMSISPVSSAMRSWPSGTRR